MYAIKVEDRYLVEVDHGSIKTSSKPRTYSDLRSAKTALDKMMESAAAYEAAFTGYAKKGEALMSSLGKRVDKITELLESLYDQPYREVNARIQKLEKERTQKLYQLKAEHPSIASWKRDATRMRTLVAKKPQIVVLGDRPLSSVDILDILKV
jgi:hypothetical protein